MANRYGYTPIMLGWAMQSISTSPASYASPAYKSPDKFEVKPIKSPIELTSKTGQLTEMEHETIGGRYYYEFTISGELNNSHQGLLKAFLGDASSPLTVSSANTRSYYELHRRYTSAVADILKGCVFRTFKITGETNGVYNFEVTGWATAYTENVTVSGYASYPTYADEDYDITPFLFGDTTITSLCAQTLDYTDAFSIDLSLEYTFDDEKYLFLNNDDLQAITLNKFSGTLSFSTLYVVGKEGLVANLYDNDPESGQAVFAITDGTATWTITTNGVITEYTRPDPDRQLYEASVSTRLQGYYAAGTYTNPISIAIS